MGPERVFELPTWAALPARPHPAFDRLAQAVAEQLCVPIALISLVSKGGQVFPGAVGLPAPWSTRRSWPLSYSLSQHVTTTGRSMIVDDARLDPVLCGNGAVRDLGIVAFAGVPLLDAQGRPLGALSASDRVARHWLPADVEVLERLAAQGSRLLQVQALDLAERESRAACERAATAAEQAARAAQAAFEAAEAEADRARVVARLAVALLAAETLGDVLRIVDRLVRSPLGATAAVLGVVEAGSPLLQAYPAGPSSGPGEHWEMHVDDAHPLAVAVRERRLVTAATREEADQLFATARRLPDSAAESTLALPLVLGEHASSGALLLSWSGRRELDDALGTVLTELAGQLGHALDRVLLAAARQHLARSLPSVAVG
jgi:hypothetical protein